MACEFSGIVREAFKKEGCDAWSCDLLPSEIPGHHIQENIKDVLEDVEEDDWDLLIAHPPCTHLAVSGARWFKDKKREQLEAIKFFMLFTSLPVRHICIENPISIMSSNYMKPNQIIQPWMFCHPETKATCLWLKNLPKLVPLTLTRPDKLNGRVWKEPPGKNRWKNRSRTYPNIANAMAKQWSKII